jgi:hypothetical protein
MMMMMTSVEQSVECLAVESKVLGQTLSYETAFLRSLEFIL